MDKITPKHIRNPRLHLVPMQQPYETGRDIFGLLLAEAVMRAFEMGAKRIKIEALNQCDRRVPTASSGACAHSVTNSTNCGRCEQRGMNPQFVNQALVTHYSRYGFRSVDDGKIMQLDI